ncbi:hypothetical protein AWH48_05690 [Domibacillus aminovorans]|uniref:GAF domain-containing protein n=1 Tax=Domibacillus aminovorans TaxID=29332 RepID=A0A177KSJ7_9BACI|nr:GAF domain-containing protein [Domibacillus aminovorans]OAH56164.1 hypothetical protein AWH48_05690 [Domibacillus aminovorans]
MIPLQKKQSIIVTIIYVLIFYTWISLRHDLKLVGFIIAITGPMLTLIIIGSSLQRIKEKEEKNFWGIIFIGCFGYLIGELIWRYREYYLGIDDPFPGWANLFYNVFVFMYSIAVFYKVYVAGKKYRMIQVFFDCFIIMTLLTTIGWVYFLNPLLSQASTRFELIVSLSYPVAILGVLLGIILLFLTSKSLFPNVLLILNTIGITIYTMAETYYVYQSIYYTYSDDITYLSPVWNICLLLIGISSFYSGKVNNVPQKENKFSKVFYISQTLLPFLSLLILLFLALTKKESILSFFIGGAILLCLIIIRQVITIFENDILVRKLKERTEELEVVQLQLMGLKDSAEEQSWLKTKIAEIATMYSGIDNIETLARQLITKITPMVRATYAVIYVKDDKGIFQKLAAYADTRQGDIGASSFHLGEGIVGQCALENRIIVLNRIPKDYIKITSGLGSKQPSHVTVIPAEFQGEVLAVIELASFQSFSHLEEMLLQEVVSNLGINIQSILGHMQVEKLLQESQALTEELQSQSEKLQSQQPQLRAVNEQLEEQYQKSEQKAKEVKKVKNILEEKAKQLTLSSQSKS